MKRCRSFVRSSSGRNERVGSLLGLPGFKIEKPDADVHFTLKA